MIKAEWAHLEQPSPPSEEMPVFSVIPLKRVWVLGMFWFDTRLAGSKPRDVRKRQEGTAELG